MDKIIIQGQNSLSGSVNISGAKNAVLPIMTAALMAEGESVISRVPDLRDTRTMIKLMEIVGAKCSMEGNRLKIDADSVCNPEAPYDLVKTMRSSILVLGPLLARFGEAKVSLPGGCAIGLRPVDMHLKALEKMGAEIKVERGYITAQSKRLKGANITFDKKSVTGTENIIMAASLAKGLTKINNAANEPEISDLCLFLNKMGAKISGHGTDVIEINGVDALKGTKHKPLPDRIEAGTFMIAAAITKGDVEINNIVPEHSDAVIEKLLEAGAEITSTRNSIRVKMRRRPKAVNIETNAYPYFPTDMQAQMTALNAVAKGDSFVKENIFENRFMHVQELERMGALIKVNDKKMVSEISPIEYIQDRLSEILLNKKKVDYLKKIEKEVLENE